jgi:hypothetical protein
MRDLIHLDGGYQDDLFDMESSFNQSSQSTLIAHLLKLLLILYFRSIYAVPSTHLQITAASSLIVAEEVVGSILGLIYDALALSRCIIGPTTDLIRSGLGGRLVLVGDDGSGDTVVCARKSLRGLLSVRLAKR